MDKKGKIREYEFEVIVEKENKVIGRKEIIVKLEGIGKETPKREVAREIVAEIFKWDKNLVVIRKIRSYYGLPRFFIEAHLYKDKNILEYFEPKHILKRNGLVEVKQEATS